MKKNQEISNYNDENPIYSKVVRISNRETFGIKDGRFWASRKPISVCEV